MKVGTSEIILLVQATDSETLISIEDAEILSTKYCNKLYLHKKERQTSALVASIAQLSSYICETMYL